jgi:tol-pal system protein YbgF
MANAFTKFLIFLPAVIFFVTSCASQKDIINLSRQLNALSRQTKKDGKRVEKSIKELKEAIEANEARHKETEGILKEANEARHKETEGIFKEANEARHKETERIFKEAIEANEARHKETEGILKEDQESLRLTLAQLGADLGGLRDNIQGLTGRIEESAHLLKSTIEEDTTKEDAMVSQMRELSLVTEDLILRMQSLENYVSCEIAAIKEKAALEKTSPALEIEKNDSPPPQKKELTESEIYDRTLGLYKDGRYEEAIADFKSFLKSYPESDLADNAHFWSGECFRALKEYEEAILAYQRVINGYPKGNKVPSAMLHQGFAFEKINDKTTANLVFKKLVKNFPKTREAESAKRRLRKK